MPNWVFNSLVVSGDKSELETMVAQLNQPVTKHYPDTNWNDETKSWDKTPAVQQYDNPVFSFWNVISPSDIEAYYGEEVFKKSTAEAVGNKTLNESLDSNDFLQEFHRAMNFDNDWYHWNVRNWGTKWEPSDVGCRVENNSKIYINFQTAWSPPDPVILAFIESVTQHKFFSQYIEQIELEYDEVGMGFWGKLTWDCETKQIVEKGGDIDCEWLFDNWERCDCDEHACPTCGEGGYPEDTPIEERYDCDCMKLPTIDEEGEALDTEELYG